MQRSASLTLVLCAVTAGAVPAQGGRCDRACLVGIADQYVEALAAKDPSKVALTGWHIAEVFKVEKGLLHEIEAVLERAPYGMTSGWSSWENGMSDAIQWEDGR